MRAKLFYKQEEYTVIRRRQPVYVTRRTLSRPPLGRFWLIAIFFFLISTRSLDTGARNAISSLKVTIVGHIDYVLRVRFCC